MATAHDGSSHEGLGAMPNRRVPEAPSVRVPSPGPSELPQRTAAFASDAWVSDWALGSSPDDGLSVDSDLAAVGRCGIIDLRTGFTCVGPNGHQGRCQFVDSHTASAVLEEYEPYRTGDSS